MAYTVKHNNAIGFAFAFLLFFNSFELTTSATFVKIVGVLIKAQKFKIFAQGLIDTGVGNELERTESSGYTLFVPTDDAFKSAGVNFTALSREQKIIFLKYHVLPAYYPAGAPGLVSSTPHPTLATAITGPNKYTLSINNNDGPITVNTGSVKAYVELLLHNKDPVAIYQIDKVLRQ